MPGKQREVGGSTVMSDGAYIKLVKELLRSKEARQQYGLFVAEGRKLVLDILRRGHAVEGIVCSRSFLRENEGCLSSLLRRSPPSLVTLPDSRLARLVSVRSDQGIVAVIKKKKYGVPHLLSYKRALVVLCEGLQDPGNLGTIIRTSLALGAQAVALIGDSVDVYSPKVVRSSCGYLLDLPVIYAQQQALEALRGTYVFWGLVPPQKAGASIFSIKKIPEKTVLVFGNEGAGVSVSLLSWVGSSFHIPLQEGVDSLNVAAAVAISLFALSPLKGKMQ